MDTVVNVIQVFLGFLLTVGGLAKLILTYTQFTNISAVAWAKDFKPWHIKLLGVLELCGGLGVIIPLFLPSLTMLVPLAAVGSALYMSGAMATHLRRSEYPHMVGNLMVFIVPLLFLAYSKLSLVTV